MHSLKAAKAAQTDCGGREDQQTVGNIMNLQSEKKLQHRLSKPLLERRRRARINACLGELRTLLLQSHAAQGCRPSKLEKADILELTVRHLRSLQHTHSGGRGVCVSVGYSVCVCEGRRFLYPASWAANKPDAALQGHRVCTTLTTQTASQHTHQHLHQEKMSSSSSSTHPAVWRPW